MGSVSLGATYGKVDKSAASSAMLQSLSRKTPYYRRNAPHLCSFFAAGTCNRGSLCPYRHEMPTTGPMAQQNIKDRYFGQNDPVAQKMMDRHDNRNANSAPLTIPDDNTITTLWVGGLDPTATEAEVRAVFFPFGELSSIRVIVDKKCAFVTYMRRDSAEAASGKLYNTLSIKGTSCRLAWGKRQSTAAPGGGGGRAAPPGVRAPPGVSGGGGGGPQAYPSMDPTNMAARFSTPE
jgi:pre-mRNA-splicing factor RBM22/SLT11